MPGAGVLAGVLSGGYSTVLEGTSSEMSFLDWIAHGVVAGPALELLSRARCVDAELLGAAHPDRPNTIAR